MLHPYRFHNTCCSQNHTFACRIILDSGVGSFFCGEVYSAKVGVTQPDETNAIFQDTDSLHSPTNPNNSCIYGHRITTQPNETNELVYFRTHMYPWSDVCHLLDGFRKHLAQLTTIPEWNSDASETNITNHNLPKASTDTK